MFYKERLQNLKDKKAKYMCVSICTYIYHWEQKYILKNCVLAKGKNKVIVQFCTVFTAKNTILLCIQNDACDRPLSGLFNVCN